MIVETSAYARSRQRDAGSPHGSATRPKRFQGEEMNKRFASILLRLIGVLGLGMAAQANSRSEIAVTLPFEFVASGKTLPAGTYTLRAVSDNPADGLILNSYENRASVIVYPTEIEKASANKSNVSFQRVGEQLFLDRIQTADTVYNILVPREAILLAATPSHTSSPVSGNSGSN
jgi:hypothetical protein